MSLGPIFLNGFYDNSGRWQRTKFCFVSCGQRCDCGPPCGLSYSAEHDKRDPKGDHVPAWVNLSDEIEASPPQGGESA